MKFDKEHLNALHQSEQAQELLLDTIPTFLFRFYDKLVKEGFDKEQAMLLIHCYLSATITTANVNVTEDKE